MFGLHPTRKRPPRTPDEQRRLDDAIREGLTNDAIHARFGVSTNYVTARRKELGVAPQPAAMLPGDLRAELGRRVSAFAPIPANIRPRNHKRRNRP